MLNFTFAPKIPKENTVDTFLASRIIQLSQKEPKYYVIIFGNITCIVLDCIVLDCMICFQIRFKDFYLFFKCLPEML